MGKGLTLKTITSYLVAVAAVLCFWYLLGAPKDVVEFPQGEKMESVSYAPFDKDESPFDFDSGLVIKEERIDTDLRLLSKYFHAIRTYSVTGLEKLPEYARKHGLKVYLGMWVSSDKKATEKELNGLIKLARENKDVIKAVIVGNEALLRKDVTGEQLAEYIKRVKSELPDIEVTYADVWEYWLKNPQIAKLTDFVTIHILPYWEDEPMGIDRALPHLKNIRVEVAKELGTDNILIGETGWPSQGRPREDAVPSIENQAKFMRGFIQIAKEQNWRYNLIEAFDQPWKRANEGTVGGYWGVYDADRGDKSVLAGAVSNYPNWQELSMISLLVLLSSVIFVKNITSPLFFAFSALSSVLIVLQANEFLYSARGYFEYLWAFGVLTLAYSIHVRALYLISSKETPKSISSLEFLETIDGTLFGATLFFVFVALTGLLFDARYRNFDVYGLFVIISGLYIVWSRALQKRGDSHFEKGAALFLFFGAIFVIFDENPINIEADVWALLAFVLAFMLWSGNKEASIIPFLRLLFVVTVAYGVIYLARVNILTAEHLVGFCANTPDDIFCQARALLGKAIHLNTFGIAALVLSLLGFFTSIAFVGYVGLIFSIGALLFFNSTYGAIAFSIAFIAILNRHKY